MSAAVPTSVLIDALVALAESRRVVAMVPGEFQTAQKIAAAEGRLRGALEVALPEMVEIAA